MNLPKALAIGGASAAGVGATAYGAKEAISRIQEGVRRSELVHQAKGKTKELERIWEKWGYKALDDNSEDRKWEWLQLKKVWDDGGDRWNSNQSEYGTTYEKEKWEREYWKRIKAGTRPIKGIDVAKIKEIYDDDQKYKTKWRKFKEICITWYAKWKDDGEEGSSNDVDTTYGHACLYNGSEIPWTDLEEEYKKDTSKDPGNIYWERMKNKHLQSQQAQ